MLKKMSITVFNTFHMTNIVALFFSCYERKGFFYIYNRYELRNRM